MRGEGDSDAGLEARLRKRDGDKKARAGCGSIFEVEMRIWQERNMVSTNLFAWIVAGQSMGRKLIPTRGRFGAGWLLRFSEGVAWRTERRG